MYLGKTFFLNSLNSPDIRKTFLLIRLITILNKFKSQETRQNEFNLRFHVITKFIQVIL